MPSFDLMTYLKMLKHWGAKQVGPIKCSTSVLRARWEGPSLSVLSLVLLELLQLPCARERCYIQPTTFFEVATSQLIS